MSPERTSAPVRDGRHRRARRAGTADYRRGSAELFRVGFRSVISLSQRHSMWELRMNWTETWRNAFRTELRAEAIGLAWHGWPVVPGTYPDGSRWVGRAGAPQEGPIPLHDNWIELAGSAPEKVASLWDGHPFSLLLATGF